MPTLRSRVEALEAARRRVPVGRHGVVQCRPGETCEQAAERARAAGYRGFLIAPAPMELDAYLPWVQASHREREARNVELVGDILARLRPDREPPGFTVGTR